MNLQEIKQKLLKTNHDYKPLKIIFLNQSPTKSANFATLLRSNIFFNDQLKVFFNLNKAINFFFRKNIDIFIINIDSHYLANNIYDTIKHKININNCLFYSDNINLEKYIGNIKIIPTYLLPSYIYDTINTIKRKQKNPIKLYSAKALHKILNSI